MTINDQIRDEKLQYDINRKAAEISALSSGKIDKYEYLTGKEILPSNQQQIIEQAEFSFGKSFWKTNKKEKMIEDQRERQVKALKGLNFKNQPKSIERIFPKGNETNEIKHKLTWKRDMKISLLKICFMI